MKYDGDWVEDRFDGEGTLVYKDKRIYTGEFKFGKPHGYGIIKCPCGQESYYGDFYEGKKHGHGKLVNLKEKSFKYHGNWVFDEMEGIGSIFYNDYQY